jgi:hypothetical protein
MKPKLLALNLQQKEKGQSFVELTLILVILLTLLTGMVEFGYLLNQYITVVDAAREGARFGSNDDPFIRIVTPTCPTPYCLKANFFTAIDEIVEGSLRPDGTRASKGALFPIVLRPAMGDDVVISFFSIHSGTLLRFPGSENGWSYYKTKGFTGKNSAFTSSALQARIADPTAPDAGMVLVEIYYNYSQVLKLYNFIGVPDPIQVHTYSIMPLAGAEPTPVPVVP